MNSNVVKISASDNINTLSMNSLPDHGSDLNP